MAISRNIKSMSDDIQHLKDEVHNLDVEIPSHTSGDSGKYLGVGSSGNLAFSKVPDELPPTTSATAGQILALDNDKAPEWVDNYNLNYSESEIDTGIKWINGKNIYIKAYSGTTPSIADNLFLEDYNTNEYLFGFVTTYQSSGARTSFLLYSSTNRPYFAVTSSNIDTKYNAIVYYTKPTPAALTSGDPNRSEPETREAEPELIEEPEQVEEPVEVKKTTRKSTK